VGGSGIAVHSFEFSSQNEIPPKVSKFVLYIIAPQIDFVKRLSSFFGKKTDYSTGNISSCHYRIFQKFPWQKKGLCFAGKCATIYKSKYKGEMWHDLQCKYHEHQRNPGNHGSYGMLHYQRFARL
jgi:hypothetical protein